MASISISTLAQNPTPGSRPYRGSCHCGLTKYIAYLTLPPKDPSPEPAGGYGSTLRIRKCNCSTCHKTSFFHTRLESSPDDFLLLSPTNLFDGGLLNYKCFDRGVNWPFCSKCGVRCFAWGGQGEIKEAEVDGKKTQVWVIKKEGYTEGSNGNYLSINAATLEPDQEGFNMKEWHEKGWIAYYNVKENDATPRLAIPYDGGMY